MLTNECAAGLSGHQNHEKIKKVTTSERSRGTCSSFESAPTLDRFAALDLASRPEHEARQRHQPRREIRDSVVEGPAVSFLFRPRPPFEFICPGALGKRIGAELRLAPDRSLIHPAYNPVTHHEASVDHHGRYLMTQRGVHHR